MPFAALASHKSVHVAQKYARNAGQRPTKMLRAMYWPKD